MGSIIGGLAAGAGGLLGGVAARSAASQQANALQQALAFQQQVYGNTQANLSPFIGAGTNALGALQQLYGLAPSGSGGGGNALAAYQNYTQTPFYQFPLSQGVAALNASGAARGLTLSGGQANALQAYGQGYAGQNFSNYINALSGLANLGQTSAAALGGQGNTAAGTTLTGQGALGNALASGTVGSQNQINNALSALPLLLGGGGGTGSAYGGGTNSGGLINQLGNLFGAYTGPSATNLLGGGGSPATLQNQLGLATNQYVP